MQLKEQTLSGWGNIPKSKTLLGRARSPRDIAGILAKNHINIARGLGRSYADQSTNTGHIAIDITSLDHFISWDEREGILECEAGVSLAQIIEYFAPRGWFPMITPGTKYVTVGGCIANDVHGKAHHVDGSFVNCVVDLKILLADGRLVEASRAQNDDLFWATFGGLGLLGYIISARIRLRKIDTTYFTQKSIAIKNLDHLLEEFERTDAQYSYSVAWIDALARGQQLGKGVLIVGNKATTSDLPASLRQAPLKTTPGSKLNLPLYLPDFALNAVTVKGLNAVLYQMQKRGSGLSHYESFFYPLDVIDHWNRGYGHRGFIQYQFVVPLAKGPENIRHILQLIANSGCLPFLNVLKKFGASAGKMLSFPMEGYTFAIDFPITKMLKPFTRQLDEEVLKAGGRIYLGKDAFLSEAHFKAMYPEHIAWLEVKKKYDAHNLFSSDISRRLGLSV